MSLAARFLILSILFLSLNLAQSPNGSINGIVQDPSGRAIPDAEIVVVNDLTNVQYQTKTNSEGIYVVTNLPPGPYRLQVSKLGFRTLIKPDLILNVQDALAISFTLPLGSVSEIVTVQGGAPLVNTQDGAVGTVIGRQLVESLPLNGKSFNTLLQLTPGVVIAPANSATEGQFSIAGQRTSSNSFQVDGVSANFGVSSALNVGTSGTGAMQAFSALGGTSSLVSVEALQEFRIETSSFAPEFGRSPGGQVVLTTRSGTNDFHGGLYEYFRNDVLDANNWFANAAGQPRAPERFNDFGGYAGGPIRASKTFFFLSYEGSRLRQPNTSIVQVPSEYARTIAPSQLAPILDAYPQPLDRTVTPGTYTAQFVGNYSNPATLNAGSVRIDHTFENGLSLFGRYNEAPSQTVVRSNSLNELDTDEVNTRTLTVAATMAFRPYISLAVRGNYSVQQSALSFAVDSFGGATPPSPSLLAPSPLVPNSTYVSFYSFDTTAPYQIGSDTTNRNTQLNFAGDLAITKGSHQLRFGTDFRSIFLKERPFHNFIDYLADSVSDFISTGQVAELIGVTAKGSDLLAQSTSLYAQDSWKLNPRLTLTYGVRWELSPAPSARAGTTLASWENVNNPSAIMLAPPGTSLWATTYGNFAPRFGMAYSLDQAGTLVLRAGAGIFYDLGSDSAATLTGNFPNVLASNPFFGVSMPLTNPPQYLPVLSTTPPYVGNVFGFSPDLKLPRSYQWNVALEKSFGGKQAISVTYLGQAGRDLLRQEGLAQPNANFTGVFHLTDNSARSNYNALQVQYRRPLATRLQALLSYSLSHSLDNTSNDISVLVSRSVISAANDYAPSTFDIRQSFSGAVVYSIPKAGESGLLPLLTGNWSVEGLIVARTGFPFNGQVLTATVGGANPRPDRDPLQPVWIPNPAAGGGKSLNPRAFTKPPAGQQGTEGRNDIPGFGLTEVDLSVGRKIRSGDKIHFELRVDAFNVLNHPNFTNPLGFVGIGPSFLKSASMANAGLGGLNPLFQEGGPRSLQLSLKFIF